MVMLVTTETVIVKALEETPSDATPLVDAVDGQRNPHVAVGDQPDPAVGATGIEPVTSAV